MFYSDDFVMFFSLSLSGALKCFFSTLGPYYVWPFVGIMSLFHLGLQENPKKEVLGT